MTWFPYDIDLHHERDSHNLPFLIFSKRQKYIKIDLKNTLFENFRAFRIST